MKSVIVRLECITNMHVGNGDVNYNIIDNEVERDPITNYPTVNSSGIKGALRQIFSEENNSMLDDWFGSENEKTEGKLKFMSADLIAMPARASRGNRPYYLITTETAIDRYKDLMETLGYAEDFDTDIAGIENVDNEAEVEGYTVSANDVVSVAGVSAYKLQENNFKSISLPVMTRNCRVEGHENLWYEEVVPHKSVFIFPVLSNDNDCELLRSFADTMNNRVVQIGGNASIGYGLCKVKVLESEG